MKTKITLEVNIFLNKYIKSFQELKLINIFIILLCIFLTYYISEKILIPFNFYIEYKWLDIPVHIFGAFLFTNLFINIIKSKYINFRNILIFILFVGVGWELLEYVKDVINLSNFPGWLDTFKDLFDDMLGAYIAFLFYKNK